MQLLQRLKSYHFFEQVSIAPLITFRVIFGFIMAYGGIRFISNGWVESLYLEPSFHFKYYGFEWVQVPDETSLYLLFYLMIACAFFVAIGFLFRISSILFFLSFTYVELLDKTTYLNHYYFVSLVAFLLILTPAHRAFSVDALLFPSIRSKTVSRWSIDIIKFQIGIVYFMAGVAKLNYDWLVEAMPLKNWLKHETETPIIGSLFQYDTTAYLFSWFGALFDLSIFFLLINKSFRLMGYAMVVVFHLLTGYLFPIGLFPYVMIGATLIFFSPQFHEKWQGWFRSYQSYPSRKMILNKGVKVFLCVYIFIQLVVPFRYLLYPGNLFWTEQGFRFSWRVMLIEKLGSAQFYVEDQEGRQMLVESEEYLTPLQYKMMCTQPDMILEYAHFLRDEFKDSNIVEYGQKIDLSNPKIKADVYVRLHGKSQRFISDTVNLAARKRGFHHKDWILPLED